MQSKCAWRGVVWWAALILSRIPLSNQILEWNYKMTKIWSPQKERKVSSVFAITNANAYFTWFIFIFCWWCRRCRGENIISVSAQTQTHHHCVRSIHCCEYEIFHAHAYTHRQVELILSTFAAMVATDGGELMRRQTAQIFLLHRLHNCHRI